MHATRKIAILTHAHDNFADYYLLNRIADIWRASGSEVVVLKGTGHFEPADVLIVHVNLTVIPGEYRAFAARYPVVINGLVRDISKRSISANLINRRDSYTGPVIVKTNRNYGGQPERLFLPPTIPRRIMNKMQGLLPWSMADHLTVDAYPILASPRDVPRLVWFNPHLVVEKYLPEREGEYYALRLWVFFGEKEASFRLLSRNSIVKAGNTVHRESGLDIPDALRVLRKKLGFDYGKFDYGLVDGQCVLYDTNRTPSVSSSETGTLVATELAKGLETVVPASAGRG